MKSEIRRILEALVAGGEIDFDWEYPDEWPSRCVVEMSEPSASIDMLPVFEEMWTSQFLGIHYDQRYSYALEDVIDEMEMTITHAGKQALAAGEGE